MRLWHQDLIQYLPRQQLLGQHRECCALRGKGWGKKHKIVDYVFTHNPAKLVAYHYLVMSEMIRRGYNPDTMWYSVTYRGSALGQQMDWTTVSDVESYYIPACEHSRIIYDEHNDTYLQECIDNLKSKGIEIKIKGEQNGR